MTEDLWLIVKFGLACLGLGFSVGFGVAWLIWRPRRTDKVENK